MVSGSHAYCGWMLLRIRSRDKELLMPNFIIEWWRNRKCMKVVNAYCYMIETGCSEEDVEKFKCPWCNASVSVSFTETGKTYAIGCSSEERHFVVSHAAKILPVWWTKYIDENWIS